MTVTFTGAGVAAAASGASPQAVTTTTALNVGDYLVVLMAYDNSGGGGADPMSGTITVTPAAGAVGASVSAQTGLNDPGTASSGVCARCVAFPVTTAIPSGTNVNVSWSGTVVVRAVAFMKVSSDGITGYRTNHGATGTNYVASAGPAFTTPSINNTEGVLCWSGHEYGAAGAGDSDTTNGTWGTRYGTFTGSTTSGMAAYFQGKIVTATATQAFNPTGTSSDWIVGCLIFTETPVPSLTQAAYRFYDDGTESGSTALQAQDTAHTADMDSGDVNLQLRARLQSTTAVAVGATDDFQLQWEKNASGSWNNVGCDYVLLNSYSETNQSGDFLHNASVWAVAQSFLGNGRPMTRASLYQKRSATAPVGYLQCELLNQASGVFGSTGVPTQSASKIALSPTLHDASLIPTTYAWYDFDFPTTPILAVDTPYFISSTFAGGASQYIATSIDNTSPTAPGNAATWLQTNSTWTATTAYDVIYRVYVASTIYFYNSANLTDGAATTNRLGAGTGSFVAGKVSEDGLVDDLGWTANNYTELLYSLTLKAADLVNSDTLRFRILRNGATSEMTFTQTPTINITKTAAAGGKPKYYTGSAWVEKPMKYWNGSAFVEKPLKVYDGASWVLA